MSDEITLTREEAEFIVETCRNSYLLSRAGISKVLKDQILPMIEDKLSTKEPADPEPCTECGGIDSLHYPTCPQSTECRRCEGTGRFKSINPSLGVLKNVECDAPCSSCNGTGKKGGAE